MHDSQEPGGRSLNSTCPIQGNAKCVKGQDAIVEMANDESIESVGDTPM
jgi:hypothetical protein